MTGRSLTLPPRPRVIAGISGAAVVSLVFFPIYLGGAATTGFLDHRLHLYGAWELALPFWPMMIVPYLSMFLLFLMPPLQLDEPVLAELVGRLVVGSVMGGAVFLCLPTEVGFAERTDAGIWQAIYDGVYAIDGRTNAVPSFHVIYTSSILLAFIDVATPRLRVVYMIWLLTVCTSTVLTHRHHLLDVACGFAVVLAARELVRRRLPAVLRAPENSSWTGVSP
jgi:hypothetical protein